MTTSSVKQPLVQRKITNFFKTTPKGKEKELKSKKEEDNVMVIDHQDDIVQSTKKRPKVIISSSSEGEEEEEGRENVCKDTQSRKLLNKFKSNAISSTPCSSKVKKPKLETNGESTPCPTDTQSDRYAFVKTPRDKNGRNPDNPEYDCSTLYIPTSFWDKATGFEKQYWKIKQENNDTIVFFKKGKFYELFENDAEIGMKLFDLKLITRGNMRMAGVPESSFNYWASKFLAKGHKVAKVDQLGTSNGTNKLIERELSMILTKGTVIDMDLQTDDLDNFIVSIVCDRSEYFMTICDLSRQILMLCECHSLTELNTCLLQLQPKEILVNSAELKELLQEYNIVLVTLSSNLCELKNIDYCQVGKESQLKSIQQLQTYLTKLNIQSALESIQNVNYTYEPLAQEYLKLPAETLLNLQIINAEQEKTLFQLINNCKTPFGSRMLKQWLLKPLTNVALIQERLDSVEYLFNSNAELQQLQGMLSQLPDLDRLFNQLLLNNQKCMDYFTQVYKSLKFINEKLSGEEFKRENLMFAKCLKRVFQLSKDLIRIIHENVDKEQLLDSKFELLEKTAAQKSTLEEMQKLKHSMMEYCKSVDKNAQLKEIQSTLVLELPKPAQLKQFTIHSQTKSHQRFTNPKLKDFQIKTQQLQQQLLAEELNAFKEFIGTRVSANAVKELICELQTIDCLQSLACLAIYFQSGNCCVRPTFSLEGCELKLSGFKHPLASDLSQFVPNSIHLSQQHPLMLLTGANMGGKSTLLKSCSLVIVLSQLGSFVPCSECILSPFDSINSCLLASNNSQLMKSTFEQELLEIRQQLFSRDGKTFVVVDELGRGTSTIDGQALAYSSLIELLLSSKSSLCIFSTHFHSIVQEFYQLHMPQLLFKSMQSIVSHDDSIEFTHQLIDYSPIDCCSFATNVAQLAGIPRAIVEKSASIIEKKRVQLDDKAVNQKSLLLLKYLIVEYVINKYRS